MEQPPPGVFIALFIIAAAIIVGVRRYFSPRFIIITLIALSLPFWLFLRSWFGHRVLLTMLLATLICLPINFLLLVPFVMFFSDDGWTRNVISFYLADAIVLYGYTILYAVPMQIALAIANLFRTSFVPPRSSPGYAGSFILWPSSYPQPPIDLALMAIFAFAAFAGLITSDLTQPAIDFLNPYLLALDLPAVTPFSGHSLSFMVLLPATIYFFLVFACQTNDGLLPLYDEGPRLLKPEPLKPLVTKISGSAGTPSGSLAAVFSRRDKVLNDIATD